MVAFRFTKILGPDVHRPLSLLQVVHVLEHAARDANDEHRQFAPGLMLHSARHVHDDILVQFEFLVVKPHPTLAVDHVINFIRAFMIMQLGVGDLQMMDFRGRGVLFFNERTDLPAGLRPGLNVRYIAPEEIRQGIHVAMVRPAGAVVEQTD